MSNIKLPQMQEMLGPWWPMPVANLHWTGNKYRNDLPESAQLHMYYDGYYTIDELKEYGALPPKPWHEAPHYRR